MSVGLISYYGLIELAEKGVITGLLDHDQINGASIDITLGTKILVEHCTSEKDLKEVSLAKRERLTFREWEFGRDGAEYKLYPGEFILAQSAEVFNLPCDIAAEYKLKSSMARIGLEHLNAGYCDPGWNGSVLTLELKNMTRNHVITLTERVRIGQVVFFNTNAVPEDRSYAARGRYNNDKSVSGIKI